MRFVLVVASLFFLGVSVQAQACDSEFCQRPRPHCNSSWCDPAEACDAKGAALRASLGVLMANGRSAPLTTEVQALSGLPDSYGVVLGYSGVRFIYRAKLSLVDCQVQSVELIQE